WWRVVYTTADGRRIESANELRLPAGQPVPVDLTSADVIHSFWVPKLAGKLDMIPGRVNTLTLDASEPGVSRGQCAEYCGGAHALMSFFVIATAAEDFSAWLEREAAEAVKPATEDQLQGHALFIASGCGGCHAVRGTGAKGTIGPDLTHVGGRRTLAAATLPNDVKAFVRWIRDSQHIKPENLMPPYEIFTEAELRQIAAYLDSLE
ncbi:MAG: c-type cytochrome, partial [Pseudaminobacter sp.]|nr:c-type cytochrome [Pseudaminobacter sp.]